MGASTLLKASIYDTAGRRLGSIDEIILDAHTGSVRFVVLALGGFLGIGRERFAVPWHVLAPDIDDGRFIADRVMLPFMAVSVPEDDQWLQRNASNPWRRDSHAMQLLQHVPRRKAARLVEGV